MSGTYTKRALALVVGLIAVAAALVLQSQSPPAEANHDVIVGVDLVDTGNSSASAGTTDQCRVVTANQTFNIDIVFKNGVEDLITTEAYITYDATKLQIQSNTVMFQSSQAGSGVTNTSETLPDTTVPGIYRIGATETSQTQGDDGTSGVLFRLFVKALANGSSPFSVAKIDSNLDGTADFGIILRDAGAVLIGDTGDADPFFDGTVQNSWVVVGSGTCGSDADGDGVINSADNCPTTSNASQADWNSDGVGDACDDSDGDGDLDNADNCVTAANPGQENMDGDALGDVCDPDKDGDGVANGSDNCPSVANPSQADSDFDGIGDACDSTSDPDADNDGYLTIEEQYMGTNPNDACSNTPAANDEATDAWPPDFNDSQFINSTDVLQMKPPFGKSVGQPGYNPRMNLAGAPGQELINVTDVLKLKPVFSTSCAP